MLVFWPFKVVTCIFIQLIKGNTKGVALKVSVIVVKGQAAQHSRVGLAKLLFRNISLLIEVRKNSQFKVKVVIFTAVLGFIGIELSQVSQLLTIGLYLGGSRIYNLSNRRVLVRILVCRGITVHNFYIRYALVRKINSKTTQVYRANLVKWVGYKIRDPIKFKGGKEFASFNIIQNLLFNPFCLVLLTQCVVQRPCNSNSLVLFNPYTLVTQEGSQVIDSCKIASLKNSFYKVCKVFLVLLPQVVVYKLKMSVFKDFKLNVVVNVVYRRKVDSQTPLLLTFVNLLAYICHIIQRKMSV